MCRFFFHYNFLSLFCVFFLSDAEISNDESGIKIELNSLPFEYHELGKLVVEVFTYRYLM